jgi:hypothetical protein
MRAMSVAVSPTIAATDEVPSIAKTTCELIVLVNSGI